MNDPTRRNEDEYFAREDAELIENLRRDLDARRTGGAGGATAARVCPACGSRLAARTQHGVTIDECPNCGGVWLDRGELELLARVEPGSAKRFLTSLFGVGR